MPGKLPYFPFYPDDWLSDEKLRACSSEAIGLWIDMLCLMHKNDRRGYLSLNGKPVTAAQLARLTGRATDEVSRQMTELLDSGVPSVSEHGVWYSRKMVRDEHLRQVRAVAGSKGGKRTSDLLRQKGKQKRSKGGSKTLASGNGSFPKPEEGIDNQSSGVGGAGGQGAGLAMQDSLFQGFTASAEGLARAWCHHCARFKKGVCADSLFDKQQEFAELIRLGQDPARLLAAVTDPARDRGEHFWQFRDRVLGKAKGGGRQRPPALKKSTAEIAAETERRRLEDEARAKAAAPLEDFGRLRREREGQR